MNQRLSYSSGLASHPVDVTSQQQRAALDALSRAIDDEARARDEAARASADRARDAVWCGASLADLASVTGHSRQAARKRWPGLGDIQRRRTWLGKQREGVMWAAQQLLVRREELTETAAPGFPEALAALEDAHRRIAAALAGEDTETVTPTFWLALDDFVNEALRRCVVLADQPPRDTTAAFALHAARSVVGYYDHARRQPDTEATGPRPT